MYSHILRTQLICIECFTKDFMLNFASHFEKSIAFMEHEFFPLHNMWHTNLYFLLYIFVMRVPSFL